MNMEKYLHLLTTISEVHIEGERYFCFRKDTPNTAGCHFISLDKIQEDQGKFYTYDGNLITHVIDLPALTTKEKAVDLAKKTANHVCKNPRFDSYEQSIIIENFINENKDRL